MLKHLLEDCEGQDLVEYGLLVAIVAVGSIAALNLLSGSIANIWTALSNNLAGN